MSASLFRSAYSKYKTFYVTIPSTSTITNLNLINFLKANTFWNDTRRKIQRAVLDIQGKIVSSNPATPALEINSFLAKDLVVIINNGEI